LFRSVEARSTDRSTCNVDGGLDVHVAVKGQRFATTTTYDNVNLNVCVRRELAQPADIAAEASPEIATRQRDRGVGDREQDGVGRRSRRRRW
jgi:hypothetical protein